MRNILLSVFVYMAFNYILWGFCALICGDEVYDAWHEENKEYFDVPLLIRVRRLIKFYITVGFITIPVTIVLMIERFLKK